MKVYEEKNKKIVVEDNCLLYYNEGILYSKVYLDDPFRYSFYMITTVSCIANNANKILILGTGLGTAVLQLKKMVPEAEITAVDIDEEVFTLGDRYLGYSKFEGINCVVADAIEFVKSDNKYYDYIMVDLSTGEHLVNDAAEIGFLRNIYDRLSKNGVMAFNSSMRDFNFLDGIWDNLVNPLKYIYSNMYKAGFKEVSKVDFSYSGWIHCYKTANRSPLTCNNEIINKSKYIEIAMSVQKNFSHKINKTGANYITLKNNEVMSLYRDYLIGLIMQIRRGKVASVPNRDDGKEELINLFLKYVKKQVNTAGIGSIVKNMYICNEINYFRELEVLLAKKQYSFENISNIVMLPNKDLCQKVGEIMSEKKFRLYGRYQYDEISE